MKTYSTLGDIVQKHGGLVQTGPFGSQLHESDYQENGVPVVMPTDINNGRIDVSAIARISEVKASQLHRHKLKVNMIVYPRRGEITKCAFVQLSQDGFICGTGCIKIELPDDIIYPEFFCYYLNTREVTGWLMNNAVGSTMLNLSTSIFKRIQVPDIAFTTQKNISGILSNYVQLIDTNRRRIQLLEELARLLFREWFVYFRFPLRLRSGQTGHEKVKIVGGVPEGWKKEKLNKLVSFKRGVEPGSDNYLETYEQGSFPFYRVSDLATKNPTIFVDEQYVKGALLKKKNTVVSLDGSVGIVSIGLEGCYSTGIRKLVIKDRKINRAFLYFLMKSYYIQGMINAYAKGTTIQHAGEAIKYMNPILPPQNLMDDFGEMVE
ncbi:MAG: restriction endonuclease subunit S, partial [Patescibacteria group bacterium]